MTQLISLFIAAALLVLIVWPALTWFFADDQPIFGPAKPGRVTFKAVLQGIARDVRDLFKPWLDQVAKAWAFIGQSFGAALLTLDGYIASTPELKAAVLQSPYGLHAIIAVNFLAFIISRRPAQDGGLVNNQAIA